MSLSLLERHALQPTAAARRAFLQSEASAGASEFGSASSATELRKVALMRQKQIEFAEKFFPLNAADAAPLSAAAWKQLDDDAEYKATIKEWEKLDSSRSSAQSEVLHRHALLKFPSLKLSEQVAWLELVRKEMRVTFTHVKPFVPAQAAAAGGEKAAKSKSSSREDEPAQAPPPKVYPSTFDSHLLLDLDDLLRVRFEESGGLSAFETDCTAAQEWLASSGLLREHELMDFVRQQSRADVSQLAKIYATALGVKKDALQFGGSTYSPLKVAALMSREQLEYIADANSAAANSDVMRRLLFLRTVAPRSALSTLTLAELEAFYTRLWQFAKSRLDHSPQDRLLCYHHCLSFDAAQKGVFNDKHWLKYMEARGGLFSIIMSKALDGKGSGGYHRGLAAARTGTGNDLVDAEGCVAGPGASVSLSSEPLLPPVSAADSQKLIEQYLMHVYSQPDVTKWKHGSLHKHFSERLLTDCLVRAKLSAEPLPPLKEPRSSSGIAQAAALSKQHAALQAMVDADRLAAWSAQTRLEFAPIVADPDDSASSSSSAASAVLSAGGNSRFYSSPDAAVSVSILAKNVGKLTINVFTLQTRSFLMAQLASATVDDDPSKLSLDGLIPSTSFDLDLSALPSLCMVRRRIELPMISGAANCAGALGSVHVVEIVSSTGVRLRCVIRKGFLTLLSRPTLRGIAVRVLDHRRQAVRGARVFLKGQVYTADPQSGLVLLPYATTANSRQQVIVCAPHEAEEQQPDAAASISASSSSSQGVVVAPAASVISDFCCLLTLDHCVATWSWSASIFCDRESLLSKREATVAVRCSLMLNGSVVAPLSLLRDISFAITTTSAESVSATQTRRDLSLVDDQECIVRLRVPEHCRNVLFSLKAKVGGAVGGSVGAEQSLSQSAEVFLNGAEDRSMRSMQSIMIRHGADGYSLSLLGRTGEAAPAGRVVRLQLKHAYLRAPFTALMHTDSTGCVHLGHLPLIQVIHATVDADALGQQAAEARFSLDGPHATGSGSLGGSALMGSRKVVAPRTLHVREGQRILLPFAWPHSSAASGGARHLDCPSKVTSSWFSLSEIVDSVESRGSSAKPVLIRDLTDNGRVIQLLSAKQAATAAAEAGGDGASEAVAAQAAATAAAAAASNSGNEKVFLEIRTGGAHTDSMVAGVYQLHLKYLPLSEGALVDIIVAKAEDTTPNEKQAVVAASRDSLDEYVHERRRSVQMNYRERIPLQILSACIPRAAPDSFVIQLCGFQRRRGLRAHVVTSHFLHSTRDLFAALASDGSDADFPRPRSLDTAIARPENAFLRAVGMGDEAKYVLDRAFAKKSAGNMLKRPGLLLNAQFKQDTHFEADPELAAAEADDYSEANARRARRAQALSAVDDAKKQQSDFKRKKKDAVNRGLQDVKEQMQNNIANCLDRGDKLEDIDQLQAKSSSGRFMNEYDPTIEDSYGSLQACGLSDGGGGGGGQEEFRSEGQARFRTQTRMLESLDEHMDCSVSSFKSKRGSVLGRVAGLFTKKDLDRGYVGSMLSHFSISDARSSDVSLEILRAGSKCWWNLRPNESGEIRIDMKDIPAAHSTLVVLVLDAEGNKVWQRCGIRAIQPVAENAEKKSAATPVASSTADPNATEELRLLPCYRDLRLSPALDSSRHFAESNVISELRRAGDSCSVDDIRASAAEVYDSLEDAFALLQSLAKTSGSSAVSAQLEQFSFLTREWVSLSESRKLALWSEFASHELHIFLCRKDAAFFAKHVQPFLRNRMHRTFVDDWLLHEPVERWVDDSTKFESLSCAEKLLLAQRLFESDSPDRRSQGAAIADRVACEVAAQPRDLAKFDRLFKTALESRSLDPGAASAATAASAAAAAAATASIGLLAGRITSNAPARSPSGALGGRGQFFAVADGLTDNGRVMPHLSDSSDLRCGLVSEECNEPAPEIVVNAGETELMADRPAPRKGFEAVPSTKEIEERTWFGVSSSLSPSEQVRMTVAAPNAFWRDFARSLKAGGDGVKIPFVSGNLIYCAASFTESILALALSDLPWARERSAPVISSRTGLDWTCTAAATPAIVFSKQMREVGGEEKEKEESRSQRPTIGVSASAIPAPSAAVARAATYVSVTTHYLDPQRRTHTVLVSSGDGSPPVQETQDLFVGAPGSPEAEFSPLKVYLARVIVSNLSSNELQLRCLLQIPAGSLPAPLPSGGRLPFSTTTHSLTVPPFRSTSVEFGFYWPAAGSFEHYPAQCFSQRGRLVGCGEARWPDGSRRILRVRAASAPIVKQPAAAAAAVTSASSATTAADTSSVVDPLTEWAGLKVLGSDAAVLAFLRSVRPDPLQRGAQLATPLLSVVPIPDLLWRVQASYDFWRSLIQLMRERRIFDGRVWKFALYWHEQHAAERDAGIKAAAVAAAAAAKGVHAATAASSASSVPFAVEDWSHSPLAEYLRWSFDARLPNLDSSSSSCVLSRLIGSDSFFSCALLRWDSWGDPAQCLGELLEYSPLFNSRAHPLRLIRDAKTSIQQRAALIPKPGSKQAKEAAAAAAATAAANGGVAAAVEPAQVWQPIAIQNKELREQYTHLLSYLSTRFSSLAAVSASMRLVLCYYLLLQERVQDAKRLFKTIRAADLKKELQGSEPAAASVAAASSSSSSSSSSDAPVISSDLLLHFDYMDAFLDFFASDDDDDATLDSVGHRALSIAKRYQSYPVDKVRALFSEIEQQLLESATNARPDQLEYASRMVLDANKREIEMDALAATEPSLELAVLGSEVRVNYAHVDEFRLSFYLIDLELMFSAAPFMGTGAQQRGAAAAAGASAKSAGSHSGEDAPFLFLQPNECIVVDLQAEEQQAAKESKEAAESDEKKSLSPTAPSSLHASLVNHSRVLSLPVSLRSSNVFVSLSSHTFPHLAAHQLVFQNALSVAIAENFGRVTVRAKTAVEGRDADAAASSSGSVGPIKAGSPLSSVYVKVYALLQSGEVSFFKDGYTDLRGSFDYASLSTSKMQSVTRFALLISSKQHGAIVKQVKPPQL